LSVVVVYCRYSIAHMFVNWYDMDQPMKEVDCWLLFGFHKLTFGATEVWQLAQSQWMGLDNGRLQVQDLVTISIFKRKEHQEFKYTTVRRFM